MAACGTRTACCAMVALAKERGSQTSIRAHRGRAEAALIEGVEVLPVTTLRQLVLHLNGHPMRIGQHRALRGRLACRRRAQGTTP